MLRDQLITIIHRYGKGMQDLSSVELAVDDYTKCLKQQMEAGGWKSVQEPADKLVEGYYKINGAKRVLYWDGEKWMKPAKDNRGCFGTYLLPLDKQPNVKSTETIDVKFL